MSFNLKLFDGNVMEKLKTTFTLRRKPLSDYSLFISSEFSRARLTHDNFDNQYYLDASVINKVDYYGLTNQETKSKSR